MRDRKISAVQGVLPEILIVFARKGAQRAQVSKEFPSDLSRDLVPQYFSGVTFADIGKEELETPKGRSQLQRHLLNASNKVRRERADRGLLFSASHCLAFSQTAFDQLLLPEPFDFIKASRVKNPVAVDLAQHLINFVSQIENAQELTCFAAETIASSLLLDHYSPGMHAFKSNDVFQALYRDTCAYVARLTSQAARPGGHLLPSAFVSLIQKEMNLLYEKYCRGKSAAEIHLKTLRKYAPKWAELRSEKTCFVCITRVPQLGTECRHRICETCIQIFGKTGDDPWLFVADACFLCQVESRIAVRVHAPTAGVGILCIDGGGVRGIIPTTILELLEERVGLPIPIQDHFKLALGVSAGGLIIPALFIKGWRAAECTAAFERLADVAFQKGLLARLPGLSTVGKMVTALFSDAIYCARYLEGVLEETYGCDTKMLDPSYANTTGAKIGVPVATVSEPSTLLFTNYNGIGEQAARLGYNVYQASQDVNVWEVARGCSAAPAYFRPKYIEGVGPLQDAGVLQNNPLTLALSEMHAIYPNVSAPQFFINLGTGTVRRQDGLRENNKSPGILRNNFATRLFRSYMSLLRGRKPWEDFRRSITRSSVTDQFFRLDVTFQGPEPGLDDVETMPGLKSMVRADRALSDAIDEISGCIIASLFYFELESIPEQRNGVFSGAGHLLCFCRKSDPALEALVEKLARRSARFIVNGSKEPCDIKHPSFWDIDGNIRKRITFKTSGEISISMKQEGYREYPISGAPFNMDKLVSAQGLDAPFGTADHKKRKRGRVDEGRRERKKVKS